MDETGSTDPISTTSNGGRFFAFCKYMLGTSGDYIGIKVSPVSLSEDYKLEPATSHVTSVGDQPKYPAYYHCIDNDLCSLSVGVTPDKNIEIEYNATSRRSAVLPHLQALGEKVIQRLRR